MNAPTKNRRAALDQRYAAALAELDKAETRLLRAQNKWQKARGKVKRLDREIARAFSNAADYD